VVLLVDSSGDHVVVVLPHGQALRIRQRRGGGADEDA
jgi:hypothetical protein